LRHSRSGHLFQGRFKSIIVQNDAYLVRLSCYIHRNPLRANIVERLVDYRWSSYRTYAYGYKGPEWLKTKTVLSQFRNQNKHQAYRKKVQGYAKEEKRLLEDLRHGMILGTTEFVEKIRTTFLPESPHKEIPQQRKIRTDTKPLDLINRAAKILGVDVSLFRQSRRILKSHKADRDLMVFCIWKTGRLTNEEIGKFFGVSYSSVSHIVKSSKSKLGQEEGYKEKFDRIYSLFKT
jgi:hypothetical protein